MRKLNRFEKTACKEITTGSINEIKNQLAKEGRISKELRKQFFWGWSFMEIRYWCKRHDIDEHITIELSSTEVAILTPQGILMEERVNDLNKIGLWGGALRDDETAEEGAIREVFEETGIRLSPEQLEDTNIIDKHFHTYSNGDRVLFEAHRFVVQFDYVPEVKLSNESNSAFLLKPILSHQKDFVESLLQMYEDEAYQKNFN